MELVARFRRWTLIGIAVGALVYLVLSVRAGFGEVADEVRRFQLAWVAPILSLSLFNYALRFLKWQLLLRKLEVRIPTWPSLRIFLAGLTMTITPGKAGEVLKPLLLRSAAGAPLARTVPALVAERGTDALALVGLAALGVGTYYADGVAPLLGIGAICVLGVAALSSRRLSLGAIRLLGRLPRLRRLQDKLEETYGAFRSCLSPGTLALTLGLSVIAWGAEGVGYYWILSGFGVESADLSVSTFLYAFSTIAGAPSPGGIGVADAALQEGAARLLPGITQAQAVGAALFCRLATLWLGVLVGAIALAGTGASLSSAETQQETAPSPPGTPALPEE